MFGIENEKPLSIQKETPRFDDEGPKIPKPNTIIEAEFRMDGYSIRKLSLQFQ